MPYQCCAQADSREKVVHGTPNNYSSGWNLAFWFDIYRNVFYFHIVLGLQNLLRIWIYAVGLLYFGRCYRLCDYSLHILPAKCRRLPMVRLFYYYFLAATVGVLTHISLHFHRGNIDPDSFQILHSSYIQIFVE